MAFPSGTMKTLAWPLLASTILTAWGICPLPAWADAPPPPTGAFTMVVLPDTQYYSASGDPNIGAIFAEQTQWVVDHADSHNIQFVLHEGDVVHGEGLDLSQWDKARAAMDVLNGHVPYVIAPGNHDYSGNAASRSSYFNDDRYFGPHTPYATQGTIGGFYEENKTDNSYHTFHIDDADWMVVALQFGPSDEVVEWASEVVAAHPDHIVILLTHAYVHSDDTRLDWAAKGGSQSGNPHSYPIARLRGETVNDGEQLWQKIVKNNTNVRLILSGHVTNEGTGLLTSIGAHGQVIHQMLANYQTGVYGSTNGGNGFMRLIDVSPNGTVNVRTYSPHVDEFLITPRQQFTLEIAAQESETPQDLAFLLASASTSIESLEESGFDLGNVMEQAVERDGVARLLEEKGYFHTAEWVLRVKVVPVLEQLEDVPAMLSEATATIGDARANGTDDLTIGSLGNCLVSAQACLDESDVDCAKRYLQQITDRSVWQDTPGMLSLAREVIRELEEAGDRSAFMAKGDYDRATRALSRCDHEAAQTYLAKILALPESPVVLIVACALLAVLTCRRRGRLFVGSCDGTWSEPPTELGDSHGCGKTGQRFLDSSSTEQHPWPHFSVRNPSSLPLVTRMAQKEKRPLGLFMGSSIPALLLAVAMLLGDPPVAAAQTDAIGWNMATPASESRWLDNPYVPTASAYKVQLHCHTSNSDGADPALIVQTSYKDFGFPALAVSDHDYATPDPGSGISHIKAVEETSGANHHILHINASRNVPSAGDQATINSIISSGELAFLCHPNWKGNHWPIETMLRLRNFTGIEIYNALVAPNQNAEAKWDQLLTHGQRVLGIAVDDSHTAANRNKAWVVVYSNDSSSAALVSSLRSGNFVATQGPNITVTVDGLTITAATESPSLIEFLKMNGTTAASATGATSASYTVRGDELYIRIRVTRDSDGKKAWTNPIWENIQTWIVKWTFDVRPIVETGFAWSNVIPSDLDRDGLQEILVGTERGGRMVAVSPTGKLVWVFPPLESDIRPQPMSMVQSVDDIDGDGRPEVLLSWGKAPNGAVVCIGWDGAAKWILDEPQADFRCGSVLARDFDRDGRKEVVASGNGGKVSLLTHEGKLVWSKALAPGGGVGGALNVFDVDRDSELEILAFSGSSGNRSGVFYCLDRSGNEKWRWSSGWCSGMDSQPTVGDVNKDGEYEIVLGLRDLDSEDVGGAVILSFYGVELARRYFAHGLGNSAMLADMDEDGRMDILVGADDGFYYCLGPMLEQKWAFNITKVIGFIPTPLNVGGALGDVTGDGKVDLVFQTRSNCTLFVLDRFGKLAAELYSMKSASTGSVAIGDIDKDSASDVLMFAGSNLYCLTLGAPYQEGTFVWPMYGRDSTNAGAVPMPEASTCWLGALALLVAGRVLAKTVTLDIRRLGLLCTG